MRDPPARSRYPSFTVRKGNPFDQLAALRSALPPGPAAPMSTESPALDSPASASPAAEPKVPRAVLRYERKGRGGKEVTLIERTGLSPSDLESWCRDARRALGCGGAVEGEAIALHGDHRARLPAWLEGRGVRRVTVG